MSMRNTGTGPADSTHRSETEARQHVHDRGLRDRGGIHPYMRDALIARYKHSTDDLLTDLIRSQIRDDGEFNLPYLITISTDLLAGGVVTTAQMIVNATNLLLADREQMDAVRGDRSLVPWLLEESLRVESPVQSQPRDVKESAELGGVHIPENRHTAGFASGNRDDDVFGERSDST